MMTQYKAKMMSTPCEWIEGTYRHYGDGVNVDYHFIHKSNDMVGLRVIPETISVSTGKIIKGKMLYDGDRIQMNTCVKVVKYFPERMAFALANEDDIDNEISKDIYGDFMWSNPSDRWWAMFQDEMEIIGNIKDK